MVAGLWLASDSKTANLFQLPETSPPCGYCTVFFRATLVQNLTEKNCDGVWFTRSGNKLLVFFTDLLA